MTVRRAHFIVFVADQAASTRFYATVLGVEPTLDVPGMTELPLGEGAILGLMPRTGATRLLGGVVGEGKARGELYLLVDDPSSHHARALALGATELSPLALRDWGHEAAYSIDPDGHVVAFAREASPPGS